MENRVLAPRLGKDWIHFSNQAIILFKIRQVSANIHPQIVLDLGKLRVSRGNSRQNREIGHVIISEFLNQNRTALFQKRRRL